MAALGLTTPTAQAAEPAPAAAEAVNQTNAGPTLTVRGPASETAPQGVVITCWIEQRGGDPHVRTSTGGAGVKAALKCDHPVQGLSLTGQMYYYWGVSDLFWSPGGAPATAPAGPGSTEVENKVTTAPCANADKTWWYGEFKGTVTSATPDGGTTTGELISKDSTDAELDCGPVT
jgi:hypothetical protein